MKDDFERTIFGAHELSERELMLVQGGNFLGDAWSWVKGKANAVGDAISTAIQAIQDTINHPFPPRLPPPFDPAPPRLPPIPRVPPPYGRI